MVLPISEARPLLLGSGSPRRKSLLGELRIPFVSHAPCVVEDERAGEAPNAYIERVTALKYRAAIAGEAARTAAVVLVADTIVVLDGAVLGKPSDVADAEHLLSRLSGRTHEVFTRYALGFAESDAPAVARTVRSEVSLRAASRELLRRYAGTGEGLDKAGAYAVQGIGAFLVERIVGSYTNVVGLPVSEVVSDLEQLGLLPSFP